MRIADPRFLFAAALAAVCLAPSGALAQADSRPTWNLKLGFSYLATSGNAETSSSSLDAGFNRAWRAWSVEGSAVGVAAARRHRRSAENYNALVRIKRRLRKRLQLTHGLRWERDRFAGLDGRQTADVSVLWEVRDTPGSKLRVLGGLSLGREDPRGDRNIANSADSLGGLLQVSGDARISETASWDGEVILFPDFDDLDDYRVHGRVGLQCALNRHLGLRLGYGFKFDRQPVAGFGTTDTSTTAALTVQLGGKAVP